MAGTGDPFLDQIIARRSQFGLNTGGGFGVDWTDAEQNPVMPLQLGGQTLAVPEETLSPEELAQLTGLALPEAQPDEGSGFSFFDALIDTLDIPGAFVRGLTGAGLSALQGKFGEAGQRVLSAFPGSETIAPMLGLGKGTAPTGEDLLVDLGMTRGTTSEDERRVRLAKQAGLSEAEARRKFGRLGDAKMDVETSREFDALMDTLKGQEGIDLGVTWEDAKNAADFGDVAGIGVEVLTDPLTYMTFGASAAGKAATAVKGLEKSANIAFKTGKMAEKELTALKSALKSLKSADSLEGALTALKGAKLPEKQMGRLEDLLTKAWREGKPNLDLADTWGKQARAGQREISFMGKKITSGEGIFEKLSVLGESDTARALREAQPDKFGESHRGGKILEAIRSWFQPIRSRLSGKTGLEALDEAADLGRIATRTGLTEKGRELGKLSYEIKQAARLAGVDEAEAMKAVSDAVELSKRVNLPANATEDAAGRKWYHGTKYADMTAETLDDVAANQGGLYGPGLYLTEDKAIAETYATLRGKEAGAVFEVGVKPRTIIDAEKATPPKAMQTIKTALRGMNEEAAQFALAELKDDATLTDVVKAVKRAVLEVYGGTGSGSEGWEVLDNTLRDIYGALRREGFDGLRHTGGQKMGQGKKLHEVLVLFDPQGSATGAAKTIASVRRVEREAATIAAESMKAGLPKEQVAQFAAAVTKVNKEIADKLHQVPLPFKELDDETLDYLHRSMTQEARDWLKTPKNAAAFEEKTGLRYNARAGIFMHRTEAWKGKAISEINAEVAKDFKVKQFFHEDPAWATRRMVNQAQRAIGNAVFGEEVIQRFGKGGMPEDYKGISALDVYKKLGLQVPEDAKAVSDLARTAIPEEIYKFVVQAAEIQKTPSKAFQVYKAVTDWMKATVTVLFPAFHGRNLLENTFKNVIEGNTNPKNWQQAGQLLALAADTNAGGPGFVDRLARSAKGIIQKGGKYDVELQKLFKENGLGNTAEEAIDWMYAHGVLENRVSGEFGAVLRDGPAAAGAPAAASNAAGVLGSLLGTHGAPIRAGFALASGTENWHRVSMFIDRLKKGLSSADAVSEVKRIFFDYRDLSQWESKFVQQYGFFYNFYRNNLRYITQQALEHPVRSKVLLEAFSEDPDNPRFRWLSQKGALKLGGADVSLGFLPQQQFGMFNLAEGDVFDKIKGKMGEAIGQANPLISNAANIAYGKDLYSNTPLEYKTRAADFGAAPDWFRKLTGYEQTTDGGARVNWQTNAAIAFVPAFARVAQNLLSMTEKDKDYFQKFARVFAGVGVTYKTADELRKRDMELIDRNIQREAKGLRNLREVGKASYAIDPKTREGRILAALANPTKDNVKDLLTDNEIGARIMPHITVGPKGEPVMNRFLRDAIDEVFREKHPDYAALFDAQRLRRKLKIQSKDQMDLEADEVFEQLFGETQ